MRAQERKSEPAGSSRRDGAPAQRVAAARCATFPLVWFYLDQSAGVAHGWLRSVRMRAVGPLQSSCLGTSTCPSVTAPSAVTTAKVPSADHATPWTAAGSV